MTTHDLRKVIHIYSYNSHSEGCAIYYIKDGKSNGLLLNKIQLFEQLKNIGSLDDDCAPEEYDDYNLNQFDALSLVLRYELDKAITEEINNSDLGKALDKLK